MLRSYVAITGASGFVGKSLISYLSQEVYDLMPVGRAEGSISYPNFLGEGLNNTESIVHLAGKAHDLKNTSEEIEYFKVNRDLTIELYDAYLKSNAKNFVFISSVKAVADVVEGILTEDYAPNPKTAYGKSKQEAEQYILNNLPKEENKRVFVLRPCMVHGPGNKGNLNLLYGLISKGIPYPFGVFQNARSFLSVENLCFGIEKMIARGSTIESGTYNMADTGVLSTVELVELISSTLNKKPKIWNLPKFFVGMIGKMGNVLPLPVNEEKIGKLTESYVVSNAKIIEALGEPLPVSLRSGLERTITSFNVDNS